MRLSDFRSGVLLGFALSSCGDGSGAAGSASGDSASAAVEVASTGTAAPSASAVPSASATALPSAASTAVVTEEACPADMVLAQGLYCPEVEQRCLRHTREWDEAQKRAVKGEKSHVSERCLEFANSKCLSKERKPMRFCIDKHEWPNQLGQKPAFMVTWGYAQAACSKLNKRLCSEAEFTFACEGEEMLPYAYGLVRDEKRCNIDKPYVQPRFRLQPYDDCLKSRTCKAHMEELDQREVIGDRPNCNSPFGAFDINGNVNEWVTMPNTEAPWRSGLKGGWWGPSRSRCRPVVTSHNENYVGYEVGFRCCRDAGRS
jgi:formylglycine-generating enzyme